MLRLIKDILDELMEERNPNTKYLKPMDYNDVDLGPDEIDALRSSVINDLIELEKGNTEDIMEKARKFFKLYKAVHGVEHPDKERLWQELSMI